MEYYTFEMRTAKFAELAIGTTVMRNVPVDGLDGALLIGIDEQAWREALKIELSATVQVGRSGVPQTLTVRRADDMPFGVRNYTNGDNGVRVLDRNVGALRVTWLGGDQWGLDVPPRGVQPPVVYEFGVEPFVGVVINSLWRRRSAIRRAGNA